MVASSVLSHFSVLLGRFAGSKDNNGDNSSRTACHPRQHSSTLRREHSELRIDDLPGSSRVFRLPKVTTSFSRDLAARRDRDSIRRNCLSSCTRLPSESRKILSTRIRNRAFVIPSATLSGAVNRFPLYRKEIVLDPDHGHPRGDKEQGERRTTSSVRSVLPFHPGSRRPASVAFRRSFIGVPAGEVYASVTAVENRTGEVAFEGRYLLLLASCASLRTEDPRNSDL